MPLHHQIDSYLKRIFSEGPSKPLEHLNLEEGRERMRAGRIATSTEPIFAETMDCDGVKARLYKPIYRVTKEDREKKINTRYVGFRRRRGQVLQGPANRTETIRSIDGLVYLHSRRWRASGLDCYDDVCAK